MDDPYPDAAQGAPHDALDALEDAIDNENGAARLTSDDFEPAPTREGYFCFLCKYGVSGTDSNTNVNVPAREIEKCIADLRKTMVSTQYTA